MSSATACPPGQTMDANNNCVGAGGRRRTMKVKTLRRMLKAKGKKTTGKKATLMKRLHMRGGGPDGEKEGPNEGGRRRRSRRSRGIFHF